MVRNIITVAVCLIFTMLVAEQAQKNLATTECRYQTTHHVVGDRCI